MNSIINVLNSYNPGQTLREDEYFDPQDGLVHCKRCHGPRQKKYPFMDTTITLPFPCSCIEERWDQEDTLHEHRELLAQISHLRSNGLQDKTLYHFTFDNDSGYNPEISRAQAYVENWERMKTECIGLLFWGATGTGKTFMAGCIANALIEQCVPVLMTDTETVMDKLKDLYSGDYSAFFKNLRKYELLIWDDFGADRGSLFSLEQIYRVIDAWYRTQKPLIITTNLTLNELKKPPNVNYARIYSRILERCVPVKINNLDIRAQIAKSHLSDMKTITVPTHNSLLSG